MQGVPRGHARVYVGGDLLNIRIPTPSGGLMKIGTVTSASGCLAIPASHTLQVVDAGARSTLRWTVNDPLALNISGTLGHSWETPKGKSATKASFTYWAGD